MPWQELATALCLVLVIEGILPFLYPARWRDLAQQLATVDDATIRTIGFVSMVSGAGLLFLLRG